MNLFAPFSDCLVISTVMCL